MRESELLAHIYARSAGLTGAGAVLVGPGDDCAVVATPSGDRLLLKVDQVVSGRHFVPFPRTPLDLIARKAVARAVSDVAACGGTPTFALAAATLPRGAAWANELFDAMHGWAGRWGCPLVGGDIAVSSADELVLGVTVIGLPHRVRGPVLRSGARPGDGVFVTGALGGSLDRATGLGRHLTFEPRLADAEWLCGALGDRLHAMMDLSDGLGRDAARMGEASGARLRIETGAIPRAPGVDSWERAAAEGEDYELLFTAPAGAVTAARTGAGTPLTRIGTVAAGAAGAVFILPGGGEMEGAGLGWDHGAD